MNWGKFLEEKQRKLQTVKSVLKLEWKKKTDNEPTNYLLLHLSVLW